MDQRAGMNNRQKSSG